MFSHVFTNTYTDTNTYTHTLSLFQCCTSRTCIYWRGSYVNTPPNPFPVPLGHGGRAGKGAGFERATAYPNSRSRVRIPKREQENAPSDCNIARGWKTWKAPGFKKKAPLQSVFTFLHICVCVYVHVFFLLSFWYVHNARYLFPFTDNWIRNKSRIRKGNYEDNRKEKENIRRNVIYSWKEKEGKKIWMRLEKKQAIYRDEGIKRKRNSVMTKEVHNND